MQREPHYSSLSFQDPQHVNDECLTKKKLFLQVANTEVHLLMACAGFDTGFFAGGGGGGGSQIATL